VIRDDELCAGVRRLSGDEALPVRVLARSPLVGPEIGSGAHFERIRLEIAGESIAAVLTRSAPAAPRPSTSRPVSSGFTESNLKGTRWFLTREMRVRECLTSKPDETDASVASTIRCPR
jgi:hypothetical protein